MGPFEAELVEKEEFILTATEPIDARFGVTEAVTVESADKVFDTIGWDTNKKGGGFSWQVTGFTHGKGTTVLDSGTKPTRAQASAAAKKSVLPIRRQNNKMKNEATGHFESMVDAETLLEGVAETIREQIKAIDFWALARWGARNFVKSDSGFNLPAVVGQPADEASYRKFGPGLQFNVRGSKLSRGGKVYVMLDRGRDLYTILAGRITRRGGSPVWITTSLSERIPVENLVKVLDGVI